MLAFLPEGSRLRARHLLQSYFDHDTYLDWLESISAVPYLKAELAEIPATFEALYVRPSNPSTEVSG